MKSLQRRHGWGGFLVMGGMVAASTIACSRGPVKLSEARGFPRPVQLRFVRLGHQMRELTCLNSINWDRPDSHCLEIAGAAHAALQETLSPEMTSLSATQYPRSRELMLTGFDLQGRVEKVSLAVRHKEFSRAVEAAADAGRRASNAEKMIDAAFTIDDPSWGDEWKMSLPVHATESPPPVAAKPPEPEQKAGSPTPSESPVPSPSPSSGPGSRAMLPRMLKQAGPTAASLLEPLTQSLMLLSEAEHEPGRLVDASARAQVLLNSLTGALTTFREAPRAEPQQADAAQFADKVDRARGVLLRVCTKYSTAARKVIQVTGDDFVFREADDLLEKAQAEVDALQHSIPVGVD